MIISQANLRCATSSRSKRYANYGSGEPLANTPPAGGPLDSGYLFDTYIEAIRQYKRERTMYQPPQDHHPPPLLGDMLGNERVNVHPSMATT